MTTLNVFLGYVNEMSQHNTVFQLHGILVFSQKDTISWGLFELKQDCCILEMKEGNVQLT